MTRLVSLTPNRKVEGTRTRGQQRHRPRPEEVQELIAAYRAGKTIYRLAKDFTINRRTVAATLARHGIARRYNLLDDEALAVAGQLSRTDWSLARVADHFGVSAGTAAERLAQS